MCTGDLMSDILRKINFLSRQINFFNEKDCNIKKKKRELSYIITDLTLKNFDLESELTKLKSQKEIKNNYENELKKIIHKFRKTCITYFVFSSSLFSLLGLTGLSLSIFSEIINSIIISIILFSVIVPTNVFLFDYTSLKSNFKSINLEDINKKIDLLYNEIGENNKIIAEKREEIRILDSEQETIELKMSSISSMKSNILTELSNIHNEITNNKSDKSEVQKVKKLDSHK